MTTKDEVLMTPSYVELMTTPVDETTIPDGVALVGTTLYVDREARGQIFDRNHLPFAGLYRIDYFTTTD